MADFFLGLDLGQASDYTGLSILERQGTDKPDYHLRHLERPKLGTPYPVIVNRVQELMLAQPLKGNTVLAVDATGVGRPVVDLLEKAGLQPEAITITGGDVVSRDDQGGYHVPKRDLVTTLQVVFQAERLKIAEGLELAPVLIKELLAFRVKINLKTAHDSYEAWREGDHDDLVLSVALAVWAAERDFAGRGAFAMGRIYRGSGVPRPGLRGFTRW